MDLLLCKMNKNSEFYEIWAAMNKNDSTVMYCQNKPLEIILPKQTPPFQMSNIYTISNINI